MSKKGCQTKRSFLMSTDGQDISLMVKLRNQGCKELYYTAPYHWGVINPKTREIITYTEGDVDRTTCKNNLSLMKEATRHIEFMKKTGHHSSTWKEGEDTVKKL